MTYLNHINWKSITLAILLVSLFSCEYKSNSLALKSDCTLYLPRNANFSSLLDSIRPNLRNEKVFIFYAKMKGLNKSMPSGKYLLKKELTYKQVVGKLLRSEQDHVRLRLKNYRNIYEMASNVSEQIEADSLEVLVAIKSFPYSKTKNNNPLFYYIPDTFFVWWDMKPEHFVQKMYKHSQKFWNKSRIKKALALGMTQEEVYILASLVQMEASVSFAEQKKVARVYLNRLKKGMKLDSDPTAVYGYALDHGFKKVYRVYKFHIKYNSKYNTYLNKGLPPGPICMPNPSCIDAVLNPALHNYVYFCAKPDNSGTHVYTNNIKEHQNNANRYRKWLNKKKIK